MAHFRFIGRERYGGVTVVRDAITREPRLFEQELATDLAGMPGLERWGAEDLRLLAGLFVNLMVSAGGDMVSPEAEDPAVRRALEQTLRHQARMIVVGAARALNQRESPSVGDRSEPQRRGRRISSPRSAIRSPLIRPPIASVTESARSSACASPPCAPASAPVTRIRT